MKKIFSSLVLLLTSSAFSQSIDVNNFLEQVKTNNNNYKFFIQNILISQDKAKEANLLTTPNAYIDVKHFNDKSANTTVNGITPESISQNALTVGIMSQTDFGLSGKFHYDAAVTTLKNINQYVQELEIKTASPTIELKQSLWKNGFGKDITLTKELSQKGSDADKLVNQFKAKALLIEAEIAFYQLAKARESVKLQEESLKSSIKIRDWAKRRVENELTDKSELLQAQAGVNFRELALKQDRNEVKNLERKFNQIRESDKEIPDLTAPKNNEISIPSKFSKMELREDIAALKIEKESIEINSKLSANKIDPDLYLYGTATLNGSDQLKLSQAVKNGLKTDKATYAVGINITFPIDFGLTSDLKNYYQTAAVNADTSFQRKLYEEQKSYTDIANSLKDVYELMKISSEMENIQKQKLEHEKSQLYKGKTTTFQVLQFEQDLIQAELTRVKIELQILATLAQMKLFTKIN